MRLLCILLLLCFASTELPAEGPRGPGQVGVYLKLLKQSENPDALRREFKQMRESGIDFILPIAKDTVGRVYWDSKIAPEELVADRTYLSRVTTIAHEEGLKVYPWFCVCTEGGVSATNKLLEDHPEWASITADGRIGFIDPGNAEARRYQVSLIQEMFRTTKVDGISLDYVRASNRFAYTPTLRRDFLTLHKVDPADIIAIGKEPIGTESGGIEGTAQATSPREHPLWPEWREWYRGHLNSLMKEIHDGVRAVCPDASISSYVWGAHTYGPTFETYQDWKLWIEKGWLDWINPSGYRYTEEAFITAARLNRENVPASCPMLITIGVRTSHGSLSVEEVKRHMDLSREEGAEGIVFFTWEALKPFVQTLASDIREWKPVSGGDQF